MKSWNPIQIEDENRLSAMFQETISLEQACPEQNHYLPCAQAFVKLGY